MQCQVCDTKFAEDARFCSRCGAGVSATAGTWRSDADADLRAAQAFAEDARLRREGAPDDLGKSMAVGAALGAVIALPVPFVGPLTGAIVGAGIAAFKKLSKD